MKYDGLYWCISWLLDALVWRGRWSGRPELPEAEAVVYVSNHALALGPIAATAALPVRVYPWVIADMLDWDSAPGYLLADFVEPQLHVPPPLSLPLAMLIAQASVRLLRSVECIPVWHAGRLPETYRISLDFLRRGRSLLIFPEDPDQPLDEHCHMSPFLKSFARLGELYFELTGKVLKFFPIAVHPGVRRIQLGRPIRFNPRNNPVHERNRIRSVVEAAIRGMYMEMSVETYAGIPATHR
jgi:hypothetical protein